MPARDRPATKRGWLRIICDDDFRSRLTISFSSSVHRFRWRVREGYRRKSRCFRDLDLIPGGAAHYRTRRSRRPRGRHQASGGRCPTSRARAVTPVSRSLFVGGAVIAAYKKSVMAALALLPTLGLVFAPIAIGSTGDPYNEVFVPRGAIVSFLEKLASPRGRRCPEGWTEVDDLAGKVAVGAGWGIRADGKRLTRRKEGQVDSGLRIICSRSTKCPSIRIRRR